MGDNDKCWICLSDEGTDWKKVCPCNLRVHEQCVLQWSQSMVEGEHAKCPQCQTEIRIDQKKSTIVELQNVLQDSLTSLVGSGIMFLAAPTILTNALYGTLYEVGALSVRVMCSPSMAAAALGPLWTKLGRFAPLGAPIFSLAPLRKGFLSSLAPGAVSNAQQLQYYIYRYVGIPAIPIWLCTSGKYSKMAGGILMGIASNVPMRDQEPLMGVIVGRYLYEELWNATAGRYLARLAHNLREDSGEEDPREQFDRLIDQARRQAAAMDPNAEGADAVEQAVRVNEMVEAAIEFDTEQPNGKWLLGKQSWFLRLAEGLVAPYVAAFVGHLLARNSRLAMMSTLRRNLLALCLSVLVRDAFQLLIAYKRYQTEHDKHVLGYDDAETKKNPIITRMEWVNNVILNAGNVLGNLGVEVVVH